MSVIYINIYIISPARTTCGIPQMLTCSTVHQDLREREGERETKEKWRQNIQNTIKVEWERERKKEMERQTHTHTHTERENERGYRCRCRWQGSQERCRIGGPGWPVRGSAQECWMCSSSFGITQLAGTPNAPHCTREREEGVCVCVCEIEIGK